MRKLVKAYATRITREWNTKDAANGNVSYVLRFAVDEEHLGQFQIQQVGDSQCLGSPPPVLDPRRGARQLQRSHRGRDRASLDVASG